MLIYAWIKMNDSGSIFLTQGALPESNIKIFVYIVFNDSGSQKSYIFLGDYQLKEVGSERGVVIQTELVE